MKIDLITANPLKYATPALVVGCFEDVCDELFNACDSALDGCLGRLAASKEFNGKTNATCLIHTQGKLPAERLLLVGLGKKTELDDERIRQAAGTAVQALREARVASFASVLHLSTTSQEAIEEVCEGSLLGSYSFDSYKTRDRDERFCFKGMNLMFPDGVNKKEALIRIKQTVAL
jgi:leucyl aminopeptidase